MSNRVPTTGFCLTFFSIVSFVYMANTAVAAESKLSAYPYAVKAGVKNSDYRFSIPTRADETPIAKVYQSNGRFETVLRDNDIHFKTRFTAQCGKKWQLEKDPQFWFSGKQGEAVVENLGVFSADNNYSYLTSKMSGFESPHSVSPQQACNNVTDDRTNAGLPVASLLKKGFWTKIDQAYKVTLNYSCVRTKKRKRNLLNPTRFRDLSTWQPLFVHCVGDSDYGKEYAKTSKNTNTSSASQADIKKALDKKQKGKKKPTDRSKRTNPIDPLDAVNKSLRYRGVVNSGDQRRVVSPPKTLEDFLEYGAIMSSKRKMRLVDFETVTINPRRYYIGLWQKGSGTSLLHEPLSVIEFNQLHQKNINKGLRLADFELLISNRGTRVVSLWQSGQLDEQFSPNMSVNVFKQRNAAQKKKGFYPVDIEAFVEAGDIRYAALWRQHSSKQDSAEHESSGQNDADTSANEPALLSETAQFMPAIESKSFRATRDELVERGKQLVDIERVVKGGKTYFAGLWINGSGPSSLSKPRNLDQFKKFLKSPKASFIEDLEVHSASE